MIRLFKHYIPYAVFLLGLADFVLLLASAQFAWRFRAWQIGMNPESIASHVWQLVGFGSVSLAAMIAVGVYGPLALRSLRFATARLLVGLSLAIIALTFLDFFAGGGTIWRSTLVYASLLALLILILNRLLLGRILGTEAFRQRVLVLGAGERAARLRDLSQRMESGFSIISYLRMTDQPALITDALPRDALDRLPELAEQLKISEVVLALEERRNSLPLAALLRVKTTGVKVNDFSSLVERETGRIDLQTVNPSFLIFSDGFSSGRALSGLGKRAFDIVVSSVLLILATPFIVFFAMLVKMDSKGPAFFRQTRTGLFGQPFELIKLRSMRTDAESGGAQWAQANDPRVTRIGNFIRRTRIDELPQAWSVLKGDMSFVGPRPERPEFVEQLVQQIPYYNERHMVKPGITGWAQINYPYGASVDDARNKLEYDLYYAKNYSPFLDLLILLQTLRVVLWREGAR